MNTGQVRVSSDKQKKYGQQIKSYLDDFKKFNIPKGNILIEEAVSGSFSEDKDIDVQYKDGKLIMIFDVKRKRPKFDEFINNFILNNKSKNHYIPDWRTFVRNIIVQEGLLILFNKHNCNVLATRDTNDKQGIRIMGVLNNIESDVTKKRIGINKQFKFKLGLYLGTERLKGYAKSKISFEGKQFMHLVPNPSELDMIKDIFNVNLNYKFVCNKYNINKSTFYNIRKNKFYCGYIYYNGEEKKGIHEPLVSEEQWESVNKL